jgi:ABC-type multidrug transport system fused ATPase/permease subunit
MVGCSFATLNMHFFANLCRGGAKMAPRQRFSFFQSRSYGSYWHRIFALGKSGHEHLTFKQLLFRLTVASAGTSGSIIFSLKKNIVLAEASRPSYLPTAMKRPSMFTAINPPQPSLYEVLDILRSEWHLLTLSMLLVVANTQVSIRHQSAQTDLLEACRSANVSNTLEAVQTLAWDAVQQFLKSLAVTLATGFATSYSVSMVSERVQNRFKRAMVSNLLKQDVSFFDEHPHGMIMSSLASDVTVVQSAVVHQATGLVAAASDCVGSLYHMWSISSKGTLGVCVLLPVLSGFAHIASGISRNLGNNARQQDDANMSLAGEMISNIKTVQSFCEEERQSQLYSEGIDQSYSLKHAYRIFNGVWRSAFGLLVGGSMGIGLYHGCSLIAQNNITVGDVMTFTRLSHRVGGSLSQLMGIYGELGRVYDSAARLMYFIKRKPQLDGGTSLPASSSSPWSVSFRDVSFAHNTQPVLKDMSLDLVPGGVTALVGPSGCGKSTTANLLQRFYDVHQGTLTFNGVDSKCCDTAFVRSNVGVVSQEPVLFSGSVMDNIKFGSPNASDESASEFVPLFVVLSSVISPHSSLQFLLLTIQTLTSSSKSCRMDTRLPSDRPDFLLDRGSESPLLVLC